MDKNICKIDDKGNGNPTDPGEFQGWLPYSQAMDALAKNHISLSDSKRREEFTKEWETKYFGTNTFRSESCTDEAITSMVKSLGYRFDRFLDAKLMKKLQDAMDAKHAGTGIILDDGAKGSKFEGKIVISDVLEASPGYAAGLRKGDVLTSIDKQSTEKMSAADAKAILKKATGEETDLSILKPGKEGAELRVRVQSREYDQDPVIYKDEGDGLSYVRLRDFATDKATDQMKAAIAKAEKGFVLDLRQNPGGQADIAQAVTQMLLKEGKYEDRTLRQGDKLQDKTVIYNDDFVLDCETGKVEGVCERKARDQQALLGGKKIVVLVDHDSASAAEILAGVLQKQADVTIVGSPTKGKGEGQDFKPLAYDRGLLVTSFKFNPGGEDINWIGVVPDIEVPASPDLSVDNQLEAALQQLRKEVKDSDNKATRKKEVEQKHRSDFEKQKK